MNHGKWKTNTSDEWSQRGSEIKSITQRRKGKDAKTAKEFGEGSENKNVARTFLPAPRSRVNFGYACCSNWSLCGPLRSSLCVFALNGFPAKFCA
jgi:hypothetical protein